MHTTLSQTLEGSSWAVTNLEPTPPVSTPWDDLIGCKVRVWFGPDGNVPFQGTLVDVWRETFILTNDAGVPFNFVRPAKVEAL